MMQAKVIAIDGPAASGKTTVGKMLAQRLNYLFLDTGSMYRAVTLAALQRGVDLNDETAVNRIATMADVQILPVDENQPPDGRMYTVLLDSRDVTDEIRSPAVDANVSQVSRYLSVREEMVRRQREIAADKEVVMVGRDIGTVVLPNAPLKLYITASAEERAKRRLADRRDRGDANEYDEILADIKRRDRIDSNREHSPLRPAQDAIILDTSDQTPDEVVAQILHLQPAASS